MDIVKSKNTIRITNIEKEEIYALLKCNCKMKVIARDYDGKAIDFLYLLDRTDTKKIIVSKSKNRAISRTKQEVTYSEAVNLINDLYLEAKESIESIATEIGINNFDSTRFKNIIEVVLDKDLYSNKKQLIDIIPDISKNLSGALISMDFNYNVFVIKFSDDTKFTNSLYFWPETQDFYSFDSDDANFGYAEEYRKDGEEPPFKNILDIIKYLNRCVAYF